MFDIQTKIELKKGNPVAFKEVFTTLYPRLKGYCRLFVHNHQLIEDIIQESFIAVWEKHHTIQIEKSVESLFFVVVRNRCLNELKKRKLEEGKIDLENLPGSELQYLYQLDFTEKEEKSIEEMLIESMQKAVDELPGKMKLVFTRCKIEGRKQKEVADELGISLKMVEKQISKAREHIREKLNNQYPAMILVITFLLE
jgi:RNA polymerase sigma-70 factor (ECF subfamily)